jgi:hypothetical protein
MSILDQIRNWNADETRTDFDDDVKSPYRSRVPRETIRIVKGATDLRDAMPARSMGPNPDAGMSDYANQKQDTRPFADELGQPSEKQRALIIKLVSELLTVDPAKGQQAAEYTLRMTQNAAWQRGRTGNTSRWIDSLLTALKSAHAAPTTAAPAKPAFDAYDDVTDGNYAVERAGKTHFYRITRREGKGQYVGRTFINIQERASDELFPVRGAWPVRKSVLDSIRTAGVQAAHLMYADRLGMCWHCNRTLTDDVHNPYRKFGVGPVCGPKLGYVA